MKALVNSGGPQGEARRSIPADAGEPQDAQRRRTLTQAQLQSPRGLVLSSAGGFWIADEVPGAALPRIRRVFQSLPTYSGETVHLPSKGGREVYTFDETGRHLTTHDALTGALLYTFAYTRVDGLLSSVTDVDGQVTTVSLSPSPGVDLRVEGPFGRGVSLTLDGAGWLYTLTDDAGNTHEVTHGATGLLETLVDPRGAASSEVGDGVHAFFYAPDEQACEGCPLKGWSGCRLCRLGASPAEIRKNV